MASSNKKVTLDVAIQTQEEKLDKLDKELDNIKQKTTELSNKKIQMRIEADINKLKDVDAQIKKVESELKQLKGKADVDDSEVQALQSKLTSLKNEKINIQADIDQSKLQIDKNNVQMQIAVDKSQLDSAKAEAAEMDGQEINMSLDLAMQNFSQGIATCKQGVQDLYDNIKQVEQAGIQSEQNLAFLSLNLGAEKARDTFKEISDIVASMPGDDNTMRSVLSTAQALGNNLNPQEMRDAAATMADYMAGSATMGKMAVESQQDIMKYLLDGNTAELEKGSIVSRYVDKLKEANTFQERQKAMQEVLNQLGYGGISQMDTMLNKQAEWEGMMYNSKDALSSMWLGAEKGAMDYILKLNDASNGLVGMGIVAAQMVGGPLVDIMTGLGQVGTGFRALKDAADWTGISDKLSKLKTGLIDVASKAKSAALSIGSTLKNALMSAASAAKDAVVWIARTSKELLVSAANSLKNAAALAVEKAAKLASTIATKAMAAAQWLLNAAMSANPIILVVIAIVALIAILWYLYNTCEPVRNAIDGFGQALWGLGETIYGALVGAFEWLQGAWQNTIDFFTNGANTVSSTVTGAFQWITDAFNNVVNFFQTYGPLIAQILFVMATGGVGAIILLVANFMGMPNQVGGALQGVITRAVNFISNIVTTLGNGAVNAVNSFIAPFRGIVDAVASELSAVYDTVMGFIQPIIDAFNSLGSAASWAFSVLGMGQGSPGNIYRAMKNELEWTTDFVEKDRTGLVSATGALGSDISGSFNPALGTGSGGSSNTVSGQVSYTFNLYGDIDNEERMQRFVDEVRRQIDWNNATAGRTMDVI